MQDDPRYEDVVSRGQGVPRGAAGASRSAPGSPSSGSGSIPGIGFGKTLEHNLELLRAAGRDRRDRPAGPGRRLAQALHRGAHGPAERRAARRQPGGRRDRLRARGRDVPGPRRRRHPGCCVVAVVRPVLPLTAQVSLNEHEDYEGREYEEQEEESGSGDSFVTVEIRGLSLFTHHGVTEAERRPASGWCSTSPRRRGLRRHGDRSASRTRSTTAPSARPVA